MHSVGGLAAKVNRLGWKGTVSLVTLWPVNTPAPRSVQKQRTRVALLQAALRLLETKSFSSLSLREVTREAGVVPTAFYRHFRDMEELGLALVEESFGALRLMLREARTGAGAADGAVDGGSMVTRSVDILVRHVRRHRLHFRFVARERFSGVAVLRQAVRRELRLFVSELATDFARLPAFDAWSTEDLSLVAELVVNAMVSTVESILDAPPDRPEAEAEVIARARKQLILVLLGVPHWRPTPR